MSNASRYWSSARRWLSALLLICGFALPAFAAPTEDASAFVQRVYALYRTNGPGVATTRPNGTAYYSAALLDAFAKAEAVADGEIGPIDYDPLCGGQDFAKLKVTKLDVERADAAGAVVRTSFVNMGKPQTVTLTLEATPQGWRIADIADKDTKSIMAVLQNFIAKAARSKKPAR